MANDKYTLKLTLNVLKHLGFNLYSNVPAVLSEVVANAYDADALRVNIKLDKDNEQIIIEDNGHGMTLKDINEKFLLVGYDKRRNGEGYSKKFNRPVMGRKGIGKLSLFSIANNIKIYTTRRNEDLGRDEINGFELDRKKIEKDIKEKKIHHPKDLPVDGISLQQGTRLIISQFKKKFNFRPEFLRRRVARRFTVLNDNFRVVVDGIRVQITDRNFFRKVNFIWFIGDYNDQEELSGYTFEEVNKVSGDVDDQSGYTINGWIGSVEYPSDLSQDGVNNNKLSILVRGKMAQEDIFDSFNEGGIFIDYLIGEVHADFLDYDHLEDIATSSRQKINEEDERYKILLEHVYKILKHIQNVWTDMRRKSKEKKVIEKAENLSPKLKEWFDSLKTDTRKNYAKRLFGTIESLHFDNKSEETERKKVLYKQGIIAFEKLKLRDNLQELENLTEIDDFRLANIFSDLSDIEANLFYDIASERVEVIKKFQTHLDANKSIYLIIFGY